MYAENDIDIRNRDNVRNNGEVFTPTSIVNDMNNLVPDSAWIDKEFVFVEPTCGNGQFLTRIFEKRIANGLTIEEALNTLIGMDITKENIWDSHLRLFGLACSYMVKNGIKKGSKEWDEQAVRIIAIVSNNIFLVEDSLKVMNDYGKGEGVLSVKKFVFHDPSGEKPIKPSDLRREGGTKKGILDTIEATLNNPDKYKNMVNFYRLVPFLPDSFTYKDLPNYDKVVKYKILELCK